MDQHNIQVDKHRKLQDTISQFFKESLVDQLLLQKQESAEPMAFNSSVTSGNYRNMGITDENMSVVMDKTESLDLSFNRYTTISLPQSLTNLKQIDLSCNFQCKKIEVSAPNVESIDISFTQVDLIEFIQKFKFKQSLKRLTCFGINYERFVNIIRNQFKHLEELNGVRIIGKTSYVTDYFVDVLNLDKERARPISIIPASSACVQQFDLSNHPQLGPSL